MPFTRYGVLIGTLRSVRRDRPDDQGRWFHVNLEVDAPAGRYRCAVDVDSKDSAVGVQWRVLTLPAAALDPVPGLPPGRHDVARVPASGALDFYRKPALVGGPWSVGSNLEAATALESILVIGERLLVYGEPFDVGRGVHNVHQNQGDPRGSRWWRENGIWQDGAVVAARPDGQWNVFLSRFSSQSDDTDDDGHPRT